MLKLGAQICAKTLLSSFSVSPVFEVVNQGNLGLIKAQFVRNNSFFNRFTKQQLWKGVLSVSNAGRRKGRGKRRDKIHQRNAFDESVLGEGKLRVSWPGLNSEILKGRQVAAIKALPEDKKPASVHPGTKPKKLRRIHPLDRGWSGRQMAGRKLGKPEDTEDGSFQGFESVVLVHSYKMVMTSIFGKRREFYSVVATGNGNGLLGLGAASKFDAKIALKNATKKASKKLLTIDLIENHTVNHDFCSEYGRTKVFVFKMPRGYGLKCHRAITEICKLIGIENLHAKVEGPCHVPYVIKAFVVGLLKQKSYQQIADEKKLHLVEFKEESCNYPLVLASPKDCLTASEARRNPAIFNEYIMGNRTVYNPEKKVPFYEKLPSWRNHLLKTLFSRNHEKVRIDLMVKYGAYHSHLTAIYPECETNSRNSKKQEEKTLE